MRFSTHVNQGFLILELLPRRVRLGSDQRHVGKLYAAAKRSFWVKIDGHWSSHAVFGLSCAMDQFKCFRQGGEMVCMPVG